MITVQAFDKNSGEWRTRNALRAENDDLRSGMKKKEDVIAVAQVIMNQWQSGQEDCPPLRIHDDGKRGRS